MKRASWAPDPNKPPPPPAHTDSSERIAAVAALSVALGLLEPKSGMTAEERLRTVRRLVGEAYGLLERGMIRQERRKHR